MKKIKYIILILILILVICISCILLLNKNNVNKKEKNNLDSEHPTYIIDKNIEKLNNQNQYYVLLECIKSFSNYAINKNNNAIEAITMQKNVENIIEEYSLTNVDDLCIEEVYVLKGYTYHTYYIKWKENIMSSKYFYMIANLDFANYTYKLTTISESEYNKLVSENKTSEEDLTITKNKYNQFQDLNVTKEDMARNYLNDYINKALNYPELAYNLLDEEYRNKRFESIEDYKIYISDTEFEVSEEEYKEHHKIMEHSKYLRKEERKVTITDRMQIMREKQKVCKNQNLQSASLKVGCRLFK